jgi:hypothetical protein
MVDQNLTDQKLEAELREADARLSMLQSQGRRRVGNSTPRLSRSPEKSSPKVES